MNLEKLLRNPLWRTLVNRTDFLHARALLAAGLIPLVLPPWKKKALKKNLKTQLRDCFPLLTDTALDALADGYCHHWTNKVVDDCLALNLEGSDNFKRIIEGHMLFVGEDHYRCAMAAGRGVICVGAHFGSLALCTPAMIYMMHKHPTPNQFMRITTEPDLERFSVIMENTRHVLTEFDLDVDYIVTSNGPRYVAKSMVDALLKSGIVTTNMDVMRGGSGRNIFYLFESKIPIVLSALVGAVKIALQTGATLLPWVSYRTASGYSVRIEEPITAPKTAKEDIDEQNNNFTQICLELKKVLEGWILTAPEQWFYWDRFAKRRVHSTNETR